MAVTVHPALVLSIVSVALVSIFVGFIPALPSSADNAMEKQPACAAAISSSGLVPTPFSNRVLNEYCVFRSVPLSVEMEPLPDFRSPSQIADALRVIISFCLAQPKRHPFAVNAPGNRFRKNKSTAGLLQPSFVKWILPSRLRTCRRLLRGLIENRGQH